MPGSRVSGLQAIEPVYDPADTMDDRAREQRIADLVGRYKSAAAFGGVGRCGEIYTAAMAECGKRSAEKKARMDAARMKRIRAGG